MNVGYAHFAFSGTVAVEVIGPSGCKLSAEEIQKHPGASRFRLLDDDGNVYYEGVISGPDVTGFEPLDDYGGPNAGCTEVQFHEDGKWVTL